LPEKLTDSYAASLKQQAVPLFQGVACCKLPANTPDRTRSFFACRAYGLLCRIPETAISSAGFWAWRLANYMQTLQIIQKAVTHQARSFSCLQSLRTLMPHPRNSNQFRCFWAWRPANYLQIPQIIQKAVTHRARSFSCLQSLRTLMPRPRNSNQFRWFLVWHPAHFIRPLSGRKQSEN